MPRKVSAAVLMLSSLLLHDFLEPTYMDLVFSASIRTRSFGAVNENGIFVNFLVKTARIRSQKCRFPNGRPYVRLRSIRLLHFFLENFGMNLAFSPSIRKLLPGAFNETNVFQDDIV